MPLQFFFLNRDKLQIRDTPSPELPQHVFKSPSFCILCPCQAIPIRQVNHSPSFEWLPVESHSSARAQTGVKRAALNLALVITPSVAERQTDEEQGSLKQAHINCLLSAACPSMLD